VTGPTEHRIRANGIDLVTFEWGRDVRGREPPILLVHATGFHARVWDEVVGHLGERHVISVDQRGHGRSEKAPIRHWREMSEDLIALVSALELRGAIGVGHSMGGHALTETAAALPDAFMRLLLIDPVIASPDDYGKGGWMIEKLGNEMHPTAKRKNHFASPEAMIERFRDRPPYSLFTPAALRDYCRFGLLPAPDGDGYVLACSPHTEASVYMTSRTNPGVYDSVRSLEIPVLILRARLPSPDRDVMDFSSSPTWPGLVKEFRNGREVYLPDHTHFLPMEAPALVAGYVLGEDPVPLRERT
jgi:pimeloyl-ACP methyl ester carboxylesterase